MDRANDDELIIRFRYPWYGLDSPEPPAYPSIRTLRYPKVSNLYEYNSLICMKLKINTLIK